MGKKEKLSEAKWLLDASKESDLFAFSKTLIAKKKGGFYYSHHTLHTTPKRMGRGARRNTFGIHRSR